MAQTMLTQMRVSSLNDCIFCGKTVKRFTSSESNLEYIGCEKSCPFFTKATQLSEDPLLPMREVKKCYKTFPAICKHLGVAAMYLSKCKENYNRPFTCKQQGDKE